MIMMAPDVGSGRCHAVLRTGWWQLGWVDMAWEVPAKSVNIKFRQFGNEVRM